VTRKEFDKVVEEAWASIPEELRRRIENVEIRVVESSGRRRPRRTVENETELYGLFEGFAIGDRPASAPMDAADVMPRRITLYKSTIEQDCPTRDEMVKCIRDTVLHEIGHYFGMDEDDLEAHGIG
jgi:predicted Zn-dependent protease with MMP-like domain